MRVKWTCADCGRENISESNKRMVCYKCGKEKGREAISAVAQDTPLTVSREEAKKARRLEKEKKKTEGKKAPVKKEKVRKESKKGGGFSAAEKLRAIPQKLSASVRDSKEAHERRKAERLERSEAKEKERSSVKWKAELSDDSSKEAYILFVPDKR